MCSVNDYEFAIGRRIAKVFIESELYLDGTYDEQNPDEDLTIRRVDKPLFILLDNGELVRLYATSFSVADHYTKEYVFSNEFNADSRSQQAFQFLCGHTILDVKNVYEPLCEIEDVEKQKEPSDIVIALDNGLRLICYLFFDYFDIRIVSDI